MRITHLSKFRQNGSRLSLPVTAYVPKVGQRWQGRGVAFPRTPRRRLDCTLLACWEPGHDEPRFVLADLGPDQSEGLWYGMRAWIEQGFKLLKHGGWQWQMTGMTDPERASRLWLVLAVATRYVLAVGGQADASDAEVDTLPVPTTFKVSVMPCADGTCVRISCRRECFLTCSCSNVTDAFRLVFNRAARFEANMLLPKLPH